MSQYEKLAALVATRSEDTRALCAELYEAAAQLAETVALSIEAPSDPLRVAGADVESRVVERVEIREPLSGLNQSYDDYELLNANSALKFTRRGLLRFSVVLAFPAVDSEEQKVKRIAMVVGAMYEAGGIVFAMLDRESLKLKSQTATAEVMAQRIVEDFFTEFERDIRHGRTTAAIGFVLD